MSVVFLVNNLAGVMMLTSLLVIGIKSPKVSSLMYALQSFLLVVIFAVLSQVLNSHHLMIWSASAFLTKVILVPCIMYYAFNKMSDPESDGGLIPVQWLIVLAILIAAGAFVAVQPVDLRIVEELKPALAISLGHFMLGLLCIISSRNILKQAFGYCLMENGSHLTLALMAHDVPELVEIGIATDAIFAVIVMAVLARMIYRAFNTLNVKKLSTLQG